MRLDKYLKVARIIKRRTVANEICDAKKVCVNDKVVKASYDVKIGDILTIQIGTKKLNIEVLNTNEFCRKEDACNMYKELK